MAVMPGADGDLGIMVKRIVDDIKKKVCKTLW